MTISRRTFVGAAATLTASGALPLSALHAQAAPSPAPKPLPRKEVVKVGMSSKLEAFAPVLIGKALGEFEKENIDIQYVIAKPSDSIVLLATGRIDALTSQPTAAFFNAVAGGNDVRLVAPNAFPVRTSKQGIWVRKEFLAGRPFTPALMKGQQIASAIGPGAVASLGVQLQLEKVGLSLRDINFRAMGSADILVALENGAINFGFLVDPIWQSADTTKVEFCFGWPDGIPGGSWNYGPTLLREHRDVGDAFMRGLVRTVRSWLVGDYHQNRKVMEALVRELDIPEATITKGGQTIEFRSDMPIPRTMMELLQKTYLLSPGLLTYDTPLPEERSVDRSFLRAAGIAES